MIMDFKRLNECFNGSIFADDYRADLQPHHTELEALSLLQEQNSVENLSASVLLFKAVNASMCGDFAAADRFLTRLRALAEGQDSRLIARCAVYEVYFKFLRYLPPVLRFRVDSSTGAGNLRETGLSHLRRRFMNQYHARRMQELSEPDSWEVRIVRLYTGFLNELWLAALPEHPKYQKTHNFILLDSNKDFLADLGLPRLITELPAIASYLNGLTLEYRLAGQATTRRKWHSDLYENCLETGDLVGAANAQLHLADSILSPPFTSPFALNLVSLTSHLGWSNNVWDERELDFPLVRNREASLCYDNANFLFEAATSPRGIAAVKLRNACLDLAEAIAKESTGENNAASTLLESCISQLWTASQLFEGDVTNTIIVRGQMVIHSIICGASTIALNQAFDIGVFGKSTENVCTTEFVGILFLRLGRQLETASGNDQRAIVGCACAKACFHALDNPYLELHAIVALAQLQEKRGNTAVAARHISYGRQVLELAAAQFDHPIAQAEASKVSCEGHVQETVLHDIEMLRGKRTFCITEFERAASSIEGTGQTNDEDTPTQAERLLRGSATAALIESMPSSTIDPGLLALFSAFSTPLAKKIESLSREFERAMSDRQHQLTESADLDAAERVLRALLVRLNTLPETNWSSQVESMKVVALQYLGDFERAQSLITRVLPAAFGGTRGVLPNIPDSNTQILSAINQMERDQADHAIALCFTAKDWRRGGLGIESISKTNPSLLSELKKSEDPNVWEKMVWIACILEHNEKIGPAFKWYLNAFEAVERYRQRLADVKERRNIFSTIHSGELFLGLARLGLQFSGAATSDNRVGPTQEWTLSQEEWKDQALRFLELGRSRTLLDLLMAEKLAPDGFKEWSAYSYQLRLKEVLSTKGNINQSASHHEPPLESETREQYLKRAYVELEADMELTSLSKLIPEQQSTRAANKKLYESIPHNALVLHINIGREGLTILPITSNGIVDVYTNEMTELEMNRHIFGFAKLFRAVRSSNSSTLPTIATCEQYLKRISDAILVPVEAQIKQKEHIIFIPSPSLNKIPLSALIYRNKSLFLSKDVSQAPSLSVLQYLMDKEHPSNKHIGVIYMDASHKAPLHISTSAALSIARKSETFPVQANHLKHESFANLYESSSILLIATHGAQSPKSAWESSLLLDPPFRVLDLAKLHSNAALVIFEACVSGLGEDSIGNDLLGFSHAVLASGATAFLGGLWKLSDEASSLLMVFLFQELKAGKGKLSVARCWRNAQKRLHDLDAAGAVEILSELRAGCNVANQAGFIDADFAKRLRKTLRIVIDDINADGTNFKHPFFWAPFVLMGHAGLVLD